MTSTRASAVHRIAGYRDRVDMRIASVVVTLDLHARDGRDGRDEVEFFPRIVDCADLNGHSLNLAGRAMDGLAAIAWDVVEARTLIDERAACYRVHISPAVRVEPLEAVDW